jgi:hypothetical protein
VNARERFLKIARIQLPNAIYLSPYTHVTWHQTLERWVEEGAPPEILTSDVARYRYFGLDRIGLVAMINTTGFFLPQLFTANFVEHFKQENVLWEP